MQVEIIKLPKSEIELKIEVPSKEWQEFLDEAAKELSKDLKVAGFRPGNAPLNLVEEKIGMATILETAAEMCVRKCYVRAILENNIEAVGQPEISILKIAKGNPLEFKAKTAIMPEVKLPDYRKIASEIQKNKVSVEDNEIEEALSWLQKSRAKFISKTGACEIGDWVEIEYSSPKIENGKRIEDAFILGKSYLVPGFEENIEGMEKEQEKEFSLRVPKNYSRKDLAGEEISFKIKLKSVQKAEFPEINDQFAKDLGRFESLLDLKKNLREGITIEKEMAESQRVRQSILEKISESSQLEIPEVLIEKEQNQMLEIFKKDILKKLTMTFEDYLNKSGKTESELIASFYPEARKRIENGLTLREISKKEEVGLTEEEIEKGVNKILENNPEAKNLDPESLKDYTKEGLRNEKALAKLESFVRN